MEIENTKKTDPVKEKIILFVIGVLTGAVISTGAFFAYIKLAGISANNGNQSMQMPGGTPPDMPSGDSQGGTPPEMPSGDGQNSTPPAKPNNSDQSTTPNSEDNASSTDGQEGQSGQSDQSGTSRSKSKSNKSQNTNS